jgi:hypothetical protein
MDTLRKTKKNLAKGMPLDAGAECFNSSKNIAVVQGDCDTDSNLGCFRDPEKEKALTGVKPHVRYCMDIKTGKQLDDGSGTWDSGFVFPRVSTKLTTESAWVLANNNFKLNAKELESYKNDPAKIGLNFSVDGELGGNLAKISYKNESGDGYYIPLRSIKQSNGNECKFEVIGQFYKGISCPSVEGEDTNQYSFMIELPFKADGQFIKTEEAQKLVGIINDLASFHGKNVMLQKKTITEAGVNWRTKNLSLEAAKKGEEEYKKNIEKMKKDLADKKKAYSDLNDAILLQDSDLGDARTEVAGLLKDKAAKEAEMQALNSELKTITETLAKNKSEDADAAAKKAENKKNYDAAVTAFTNQIKLLQAVIPNKAAEFENVLAEGLKGNADPYNKSMAKVYPF